jgi:hypothetical protein
MLKTFEKIVIRAECKWFMPVNSAIWEVEIRRIKIQGQPGQKVSKILSQ